ncbi:MAG: hypothetical protein HY954_07590 [Deltaproteobacteria bacterium]|nr:hypothetical protein [Deltaproteobacteria bacterium]
MIGLSLRIALGPIAPAEGKVVAPVDERVYVERFLTRDAIIWCESRGRHDGVWGDAGKSYGIAQFTESTFFELSQKAGMDGAEWKSKEDQLMLLAWGMENGYGYKWSCWRRLMRQQKKRA